MCMMTNYGKVKVGLTASKAFSSVDPGSYPTAPAFPVALTVLYQVPFCLESLGHQRGFGSLYGTLTAEWVWQQSPKEQSERLQDEISIPARETRTDYCELLSGRPKSPPNTTKHTTKPIYFLSIPCWTATHVELQFRCQKLMSLLEKAAS